MTDDLTLAPYVPLQLVEEEFLRIGAPVGAAQWAVRVLDAAGWLCAPAFVPDKVCPSCGGSGKSGPLRCPQCNGSGKS